ncbi:MULTISPECIES: DUF2334 domain-containing protein [Paraburkholderia]|uniref:DUF2334 domain-containing protein n=1 Tax=Paraburkholderia madseniana TaxID=2599607 RepID=A0AAP5ESF0_9BURK|nr:MULTISPECIES: DUF2334 domain-containing protein [Paraburkholderia]MCX4150062.1 DUF2334 domain-containing protein [Paraburkholderia madseniana]MDN7152997.1 DUF2334 domain-containing protein [Paraburkholderia sp. WS6]MDQ6411879.1 DUF2334 domain-containing protein [Paraburkholderia madseniana]
MKKIILVIVLLAGLTQLMLPAPAHAQATTAHTLILYDNPANDPYSKLGLMYSIMLRNLLGHFNTTVDLVPVQNYTSGLIGSHDATFYIGDYYNNPLPTAFMNDVMSATKTVVWFKYNLWQIAWNSAYTFNQTFGFSFLGLAGLNATPSSSNPNPGFYDTVTYKNMPMVKYYAYNASNGVVSADPDVGLTQVLDSTKAQSLVTITNSQSKATAPYIMRSGKFWYFADMPFSYIGPADRYLVICDVLHDILQTNAPVNHRALVRLEDLDAYTTTSSMKMLTDYLNSKKIRFTMATIPVYTDPNGFYNGGVPETIHLAQATGLKSALNYAVARGGSIVMHGYTHQYDSTPNLLNAVSGSDYEFWFAVQNRPVDEDSEPWAAGRMTDGLAEFTLNGYKVVGWAAPQYQMSPLSAAAAALAFPTSFQRAVYYTATNPQLGTGAANQDFSAGQFFPYIINKDYYGERIIPENLGSIQYNICNIDPFSCIAYPWQQLITNAQYGLVVRDGFASFFFHPYWLEPELKLPAFSDFQSLVNGITGLGYTWVDGTTAK